MGCLHLTAGFALPEGGFFWLEFEPGKKDALPKALLIGLYPLTCVLLGMRACVW